jgi:phage tail-like protein
MRVEGFSAVADLVGRRVKVGWDVVLDEGESPGAPALSLRRKERDFEFPDAGGGPDPFLVYDSSTFPPAGTAVVEVDLGERAENGTRTATTAETVSREIDGVAVEVLRRTRTVTFDSARRPTRVREEILDVHDRPAGLEPGTTYYYELSGPVLPEEARELFRTSATPTEVHRSGRMLYDLLPAILRRHDVTTGPDGGAGALPEARRTTGQLRRYMDVFGAATDHLRSRADHLRSLHDVDTVDARMLPHLASWLGWDLSHGKPIPIQRHEIKYSAHLYGVTGTVPGCMLWVKRLTGWDTRIKEFWRNVFFTNDLGNPHDPADHGSCTVDTSEAALLAARGAFEDALDYVYDTGTEPEDRFAYTAIGVFAPPDPGDTAADVQRKRASVLNSTRLFLPFNLRVVVVLETDAVEVTAESRLGLPGTDDDGD